MGRAGARVFSAPGAADSASCLLLREAGDAGSAASPVRSGPGPHAGLSAHQPEGPEGSAIRQLSSVPTNSLSWNVIFRDGSGQIWEPREFLQGSASYFTFIFKIRT
uniref:Uncharacterized protein n=1 Tax=Rangifer tarandus platyrhynchus TaxID=3082113 RepID=A0ACB0E8X7_RANTA|nr:unnamed protein product [Rangifer tarandus platyrhynchus]